MFDTQNPSRLFKTLPCRNRDGGGLTAPRFLMTENLRATECDKYERMWNVFEYRRTSPAFKDLRRIKEWADKYALNHIVDFGCGSGRADKALSDAGYSVRMIDIAHNCLNKDVRESLSDTLTFETGCLWSDELKTVRGDGVICLDVLEHIPEEKVPAVVENIINAAPHGFVNAALYHDGFGKRIGKTLHMTVKPAKFWFDLFPHAECTQRGSDAWMVW